VDALLGSGASASMDFEAIETALRRQVLGLAARAVEQKLNADISDNARPRYRVGGKGSVLFRHLRRSARESRGPARSLRVPEHFFPDNPVKPLRIWMHASENDLGAKSASADRRNWVIANQRLAGVLKAKGYHYQFVYARNAGHVDAKVIRQTLPQALEYVWKDYPISGK
jgi:hypothetical protein